MTNGIVGNAALYNGTSQTTQVPWHDDLNLASNFELQGWLKLAGADKPTTGNYRTLTSRELTADYVNRNWWISLRGDGRLWWKSGEGLEVTNNTDLADGAWHRFAAVHDGAIARLYVDGTPAGTDATPGAIPTPTAAVFFGNEDGTARYHKGPLDEMRISNVPRSSNWVWAVYQNTAANSSFTSYSAVSGVVTNPPSAPSFDSFGMVGGQPVFAIGGAPVYSYTIQAATNLVAWMNLVTTNPTVMPFQWVDSAATNFSRRFYRALVSP